MKKLTLSVAVLFISQAASALTLGQAMSQVWWAFKSVDGVVNDLVVSTDREITRSDFIQDNMIVTVGEDGSAENVCSVDEEIFFHSFKSAPLIAGTRSIGNHSQAEFNSMLKGHLIQNLGVEKADKIMAIGVPMPKKMTIKRVGCFSDASPAVLGLTYWDDLHSRFITIEVPIHYFN